MDPKTNALLADGRITHKELAIETTLTPEVTKHMATMKHQARELEERRQHEKDVARIEASGPANAEIVKWVCWAVSVIVAAVATYFLKG